MPRSVRLAVLFAAAAPAVVLAQGGGTDRVFYRKDGLVTSVAGELKESAAGIKVGTGKDAKTISPADVVRVEYSKLAGMSDADRLAASGNENKEVRDAKDAVRVRDEYTAALKKAGPDARTRKFLEFREAMWAARAADTTGGPDFDKEATAAAEKLLAFARGSAKEWEVWPAGRTAARLLAEVGKHSDAAGLWATLGKNADLPAELRYEAKVAELETLARGGGRSAAEPLAEQLATDAAFPAGPAKDRLAVWRAVLKSPPPKANADGTPGKPAALVKLVEDTIAKTADAGVRGAARNALGEFYLMNDRPRDAMWEFLWVETVWNQDRDEAIKAVRRLAEVFDKLGDKERADAYREKLLRVKGG